MTRKVCIEKQQEFDELKAFFTHWERHLNYFKVVPDADPNSALNVLSAIEKEAGVSAALTGLRQAINDVLEMTQDWPAEAFALANESLASAGAVTFTQVWQQRSRKYKAILRRGKLNNDTEFYLVSAVLSDVATTERPETLQALQAMVAQYESHLKK